MKEKVSIIIPTYKRAYCLGRAIDSVLEQSYENIEVIVVDDNNNDDEFRKETSKFMTKYKNDKRVIYLKHKINKNGSAARNTGIKFSNSKYIGFLDDDDYFEKDKIKLQVNCIENTSEIYGGVCCDKLKLYNSMICKKDTMNLDLEKDHLYGLLSGSIALSSSILLFKKEVFNTIGLFDESYQRHQDYEFLIRFFRKYKLLSVNKPLVNMTIDGVRNYPSASKFYLIKEKFLNDFSQDINSLSNSKRNHVLFYQWSEVLWFYIADWDFKKAKNIYFDKMKPLKGKLTLYFYIKAFLSMLQKKLPFLETVKFYLAAIVFKLKSK